MSGQGSILIVDDEEINRAILANIFAPEYTILEAEDGLSGLAAIYDHLDTLDASRPKGELFTQVSNKIDRSIHLNYRFYPGNYVAYDWLKGTDNFKSHYTAEEKNRFSDYIRQQLEKIDIGHKDEDFLREKLLMMYANPLINYLATRS